MNAEHCDLHRDFIDVPGEEGIYYPWICECPEDNLGAGLVQCLDCDGIFPLYGFMASPQDMGECPICEGPLENV